MSWKNFISSLEVVSSVHDVVEGEGKGRLDREGGGVMAADEMGRQRDGVKGLRRLESEEEKLGFPTGPNTPESSPHSFPANRQDRVSMAKIRLHMGFPI
ncbi:hypothetical protein DVH24_000479 [Malus domestica]|uniref:Uncharacterized protein n=1 Tax=Malus domestica TaxID=3750 RepID=A0A498J025_MALDO|nr:hypothetical protein DVH24_000479 [Malus domestica]